MAKAGGPSQTNGGTPVLAGARARNVYGHAHRHGCTSRPCGPDAGCRPRGRGPARPGASGAGESDRRAHPSWLPRRLRNHDHAARTAVCAPVRNGIRGAPPSISNTESVCGAFRTGMVAASGFPISGPRIPDGPRRSGRAAGARHRRRRGRPWPHGPSARKPACARPSAPLRCDQPDARVRGTSGCTPERLHAQTIPHHGPATGRAA